MSQKSLLNDELLKNGPKFGKDYFKELLERIRSIRTSERRIWQQIYLQNVVLIMIKIQK